MTREEKMREALGKSGAFVGMVVNEAFWRELGDFLTAECGFPVVVWHGGGPHSCTMVYPASDSKSDATGPA